MEQLFSLEYMVSILLSGISLGGQLALIAIGYTMVYGILRLINFAHGDVFTTANSQLPNGPAEPPAPTELRRIRTALQILTAKLVYRSNSNAIICKSVVP